MAKGNIQGTTTNSHADSTASAMRAILVPFPEGLDTLFQSPSDTPDNYAAAYHRAIAFTVPLGDNRVAYLWQQALKIGFRAGRGETPDGAPKKVASHDYVLGHEAGRKEGHTEGLRDGKQEGRKAGKLQGLKEGELVGFEKGKAEGLREGTRLGFVAGRDFGEKQAMKLSKAPISKRVLVDIGTDSPAAELPATTPPHTSAIVHASVQTNTPHTTNISLTVPSTPLNWADEPFHVPAPEPIPPRDLSALRSDSSSLTPFDTLRYRAHRTQKSSHAPRRSATHAMSSRRAAHSPALRHPTTSFASKPFPGVPSVLDWDRDPRLSDLSRALRSLGWAR